MKIAHLLVSLAGLLVKIGQLLVSLAGLLVKIEQFTREFSTFTRETLKGALQNRRGALFCD